MWSYQHFVIVLFIIIQILINHRDYNMYTLKHVFGMNNSINRFIAGLF